jgi:NTE family protein
VSAWVTSLEPASTRVVDSRDRFEAGIDSLARRLAGRSVGVVLSGGGARGFTHIGVLHELLDAGVQIDRIGGCSMGAFVGALAAMGCDPEEIRQRCHSEFVLRNPLGDYTVPLVSVVRGQRGREMMARMFDVTMIEELPREFYSVSCDLLSGELVVHRRGPLYEAVGTSMSLPGIFAPVRRDGRLLVDGGVLSNLPVDQMATGEGPVIAVDVTARFLPPEARRRRRGRPRITQWAARTRRAVVGAEEPLPNLKETLTRSIGIGSVDALERARRRADVLITPDTGEVGLMDFRQLDRMIDIGREAAQRALDAAPELVRR